MASAGHKIKVVCRVRPFLKTERADDAVAVEPNNVLRVSNPRDNTKDVKFNFDSCYGPDADQATIYQRDVRPLVETIFSGMSATVFCYGVTGAGKTHTIQGTESEPGIIPRAVEQIFMHQQRDALEYDIRVSYYEIYKEAVFDLLKPHDPGFAGLPIREDASRKIFVAGLSEKQVTSYAQFEGLYQKASGNRRTASTKLNNHSSRSHAILTVQVQWGEGARTWCGRLHLIDLAGSEDNRRTENGKDRMAESSAINRSLFVLGQVVEALNTGSLRVPYRDSKMTRILQDSLGGESLGMMVVNVAPGEAFLQDTNNTLNFATKSRLVVNKPVAHEVVEPRWTAADRLQHHRGAAAAGRRAKSAVVAAVCGGVLAGAKRRRSAEEAAMPASESDASPAGSEGPAAARRPVLAVRPASAGSSYKPGDQIKKPHSGAASNEIMERVMRIEQQLSGARLDSSAVIDFFTPATKLKTSRGWLRHARELEQKGELDKALAHYEEAQKYAPELGRLEAHIAKLRARVRRAKRRSSIASHGEANVRVADSARAAGLGDEDADGDADSSGRFLWLADAQPESPGAEKAKRRQARVARQQQSASAAPASLAPSAPVLPAPSALAAAAAPKRMRLLVGTNGIGNGKGAAAPTRKLSRSGGVTEGSVHDRRVSFGTSALNPFVVGGAEFDADLQRRLDRRPLASADPAAAARVQRLEAKSAAAARLTRILAVPPTPGDDCRRDADFVLLSDGSADGSGSDDGSAARRKRMTWQAANGGAGARRGARVPGALGVRGLVEQKRQQKAGAGGGEKENSAKQPRDMAGHVADGEEPLALGQFNAICQASALQMINSCDVKKIMKLQGIGKRRAEQIHACVRADGPIAHVADLRARLHFKNKLILAILSTFA
ncbi:hypothetical protein GGI04_003393 [Coemansia thaxteri]|nr:hypothetical protein GGI04_003393 [Coemansia thaxteri]